MRSACAIMLGASVVVGRSGGAQTTLTPPTGYRTPMVLSAATGPQNVSVVGTPSTANVHWNAPSQVMRGFVYSVQRWMESNPSCCFAQVDGVGAPSWYDEGLQWPGTYIYRVTAFYQDGHVGSTEVRFTRPDPVNPTNFRATQTFPGTIVLQWDAVPDAAYYELFGPALGSPSFQVGGVTVFVLKNLPSGTYSWRIGSMYATPKAVAAVSTAASAFPQVTVVVP